jgi:DNA-binding CsgD family transcriptional regulator
MTAMKEREWLKINEIILEIYSSKNHETMRTVFLKALQELISYDKALFDFGSKINNEVNFFDPIAVNFEEKQLKSYFDYYQQLDYTRWIFAQEKAIVYRETDMIDKHQREKTEIFKDWMEPMGSFFTSGSSITKCGIFFGSVTLFRSHHSGNFSDHDLKILNILNDHLANFLINIFPHGINKKSFTETNDDRYKNYNLTNRENEIIQLLFSGLSNNEIGGKLFISESTVKKHLNSIFFKADVNSRTQLLVKIAQINQTST